VKTTAGNPFGDWRQRIDKWLWHARLARTRSAAQAIAVSGRVRINRNRNDSAAHPVRQGDVLTIVGNGRVRVLRVRAMAERRVSPAEALELYEELAPADKPRLPQTAP
jgi:ribosome-associated heat shock protein Hsp15